MAIHFSNSGDGLTRSASFLNAASSFTISGWLKPTVGNSDFRTFWMYGDGNFADPYIWLGDDHLGNVNVEVFDGVTLHNTATVVAAIDTWYPWAIVYDSSAHTLKFYLGGSLVGSLSINLSTITFIEKNEYAAADLTGSYPNISLAYLGEWQTAYTQFQLDTQAASATVVSATNLLAFTPLPTFSNLADTSGNGRNWSNLASAGTTVADPFPPTPSPIPSGSIIVFNDGLSVAAAIFSRLDGSLVAIDTSITFNEHAAILPNGKFAVLDSVSDPTTSFKIYDTDLSLIANKTVASTSVTHPVGSSTTKFYLAGGTWGNNLVAFDDAGNPSGSWTISAVNRLVTGMCVNSDDTICYFAQSDGTLIHIKRFDLVNNVALSDLLVLAAGESCSPYSFIRSAADDLIFSVHTGGNHWTTGEIRRYSPTAVLLNTYALGSSPAGGGEDVLAAVDYDDPTVFWYRIDPDVTGATCTFRKIDIASGTQLLSFTTGMNSVPPNIPGNAPASCPMLVLVNSGGGGSTGDILVKKISVSTSAAESFAFTTVGLSPATFILLPNEQELFPGLAVGGGYQVVETANPNYSVAYTTSNGSFNTNLLVTTNTTTILYVTNTFIGPRSGIYFIHPHKTNDTVFDTITTHGTTSAPTFTTTVVAIPNPFIVC